MRHRLYIAAIALTLAHAAAAPAHAQRGLTLATEERPAGWSMTPALDYAFVWDSNVLFENVGSDIVSEGLHMVKPNGVLAFRNRRTVFDVQYNGAFVQHPRLTSLNSYDQGLTINVVRQLSRRTSWFVRHRATGTATTELEELVGVPFTRLGVHRQDLSTGIDTLLGRKVRVAASYLFQYVDFKPTGDQVQILAGGYDHGANLSLRRTLSRRVALTGDYNIQRATVVDGGQFDNQDVRGGIDYQVSELVQAFGGVGVSRLNGTLGVPARMGPAVRMGVLRRTPSAEVSVVYNKAFTPSYGFGGTSDNEALTARLRMPFGRRLATTTSLSLSQNEPLGVGGSDFKLRSLRLYGSVGYLLNDWMRLEAFSSGSQQTSNQVDGRVNRYQFGIQVTAATTARIH